MTTVFQNNECWTGGLSEKANSANVILANVQMC